MNSTDLRYPIGQYEPQPFSESLLAERLADIQFLPGLLEKAIENLDAHQLSTPYREGGWTVKQVVHHVADSHMNALSRLKFTLTEDNPTIMGYDEGAWAQTAEYEQLPINVSLTMIHTIHAKLYCLFSNVKGAGWSVPIFIRTVKSSSIYGTCWVCMHGMVNIMQHKSVV